MVTFTVPSFLRILRLPPRCEAGWLGLLHAGGKNSTNQLRSSESRPSSVMVFLVQPNWVHLVKTCLNGCVLLGNAMATLNSFGSFPSPPKQMQAVTDKIWKGVSTKKSDDNSKEVVCLQKVCQNVCALATFSSHHCSWACAPATQSDRFQSHQMLHLPSKTRRRISRKQWKQFMKPSMKTNYAYWFLKTVCGEDL